MKKGKFKQKFDSLIVRVPKGDELFVLGDLNARMGSGYHTWEGTISRHEV